MTLGGDGTVNEAANGLLGTGVPLFPLPGGSQNVYAKLLGIPGDLVDAAEHLLRMADRWEPRTVDAGRVNGRLFTFSAGVGLDAAVVARVDANPERKARWRELAYVQSAAGVFLRDYAIRAPKLVVEAPGRDPVEGVTVVVQNAPSYTFAGHAADRDLPRRHARLRDHRGRRHAAGRRRSTSPRWARGCGSAGCTPRATATPSRSSAWARSPSAAPTDRPSSCRSTATRCRRRRGRLRRAAGRVDGGGVKGAV